MDYIEVSAKTKVEAITKASIQLGISSDQLEIEVVSEGSPGFFGIGSKPVIIRAAKKVEDIFEKEDILEAIKDAPLMKEEEEKKPEKKQVEKRQPEKKQEAVRREQPKKNVEQKVAEKQEMKKPEFRKPEPHRAEPVKKEQAKQMKPAKPIEPLTDPEEIKEVTERADKFLKGVFAAMELQVEIQVTYSKEEGCLNIEFSGDDMGILIGKRGQTLDSLQYLTSLVVNKGKPNYIRVKLDTEDYRRRRKETLENLARGIAYKVKKTRKPVVLEPMNPYERRIIHSALQSNKFVETTSEGEEPYRHVVVKLKK